ncbi:transcription regulator with diacylglycerol kinase catalytic domain [Lachnospiraceae bacterium KM106-2]|nr:transcription regulator with diacylglycerol kinase catalytic domain [Lachnospiraceae bacterium KM106-2]
MKKMLFIYNPCAGKGMIRSKLSYIIETFGNADYEVTVYATKGKNDATKIAAEQGSKYDLVVCSGGDGTLNEVTIGLMDCEKRPPCGYIPAGTTNDMASSLGLYKNMIKAAETVVDGEPFPYDLGTLNGDYFIYVAGFGAFTDVSYATSQNIKNILGRLAYLLEGVKRVPSLQSFRYRVEYDDTVIEDDFIYGMVTNSNSIGGFKALNGKDVSLNDGLFEVLLIRMPHNLLDLQGIINSLISGNLNSKFCISFHTSKLKMTSDELIPWTIDGEFGGNLREVEIVNHPSAISYITNK